MRQEAQRRFALAAREFHRVDADGDGRISALEFWQMRHETRVLQHAVGGAQFLGHQRVVLERERRARAGQTVELAAFPGFDDVTFGEAVEGVHWRW